MLMEDEVEDEDITRGEDAISEVRDNVAGSEGAEEANIRQYERCSV